LAPLRDDGKRGPQKKLVTLAAFALKHPLKPAFPEINHGSQAHAAAKLSNLAFKAGSNFSLFEGEPQ
jgi:hypothetical protein